MHEARTRVGPRLGRRARHYHHQRCDEPATEDPAPSGHRRVILKMAPDSFVHALEQLDPGSRALLDLSLHRGLDDGEIAELLGADPEYVSSSREAAITQLAGDLGMHADAERVREALMEMPEDAWRRESGQATVNGGQVAEPEPEAEKAEFEPGPGAERGELEPVPAAQPVVRERRRPRLLLAALVVVAAVVAVVIATSG